MRKVVLAASLCVLMASGAAMADGLYLGGTVGVDNASYSGGGSADTDYGFGALVGYTKTFDKIHLSGEVAYQSSVGAVKDIPVGPLKTNLKVTGNKSVNAKLGYELSNGIVVYGKLGRGNADAEFSNGGGTSSFSTQTIGAGVDYALSKSLSASGEFRQVTSVAGDGYTANGIKAGLNYHF